MTEHNIRRRLKDLDWDEDEVEAEINQWVDESRRDRAEREYLKKAEREEREEKLE